MTGTVPWFPTKIMAAPWQLHHGAAISKLKTSHLSSYSHCAQSPDVVNNVIHTGWLDSRIALKVKAGGPPWHLAVIAGAEKREVARLMIVLLYVCLQRSSSACGYS